MHKTMEKHHEMCDLKDQLVAYVKHEMDTSRPATEGEVQILGAYVDMIKDLAEAEKCCQEACYYESVVTAMDEYGENPRMGYRPGRNRMGQYTSRGRMGYDDDEMREWHRRDDHMMGPVAMQNQDYDDRYGKPFNQFREAKRHYTETHSEADRQKMKEHANEHIMESITTLREIWDNADPELRKRMKADLTKLTADMAV